MIADVKFFLAGPVELEDAVGLAPPIGRNYVQTSPCLVAACGGLYLDGHNQVHDPKRRVGRTRRAHRANSSRTSRSGGSLRLDGGCMDPATIASLPAEP